MIRVKLYATLRDIAGARHLDVHFEPGGTAHELMQAIAQVSPSLGEKLLDSDGLPTGFAHIFIDGRNVMWLEDMDTVVEDGNEIDLIPPVAGG